MSSGYFRFRKVLLFYHSVFMLLEDFFESDIIGSILDLSHHVLYMYVYVYINI